MFRKFALAGAMLLALSVPSLAACPASQLGNVSGQNAIALQTVEEAECAHLQTLATGTPTGISTVKIDQTTPGTTNGVQINAALPTGTNTVGNVGLAAGTAGGCTPYHLLSAANTNPTLVSTGAHTLCSIAVINTTGTIYYLKLYNQVAAPSTCATDAANVVLNFPIPASASGAGVTVPLGSFGVAFGTGLAFCLTGAQADNDATSAATGVNINLSYK
jgi:hypothetical protein